MQLSELESMLTELQQSMSPHEALVAAARSPQVPTDFLFAEVLKDIRREEDAPEGPCSSALLVLQQRTTPDVLARLYAGLQSQDASVRMVSLRVLREFPGLGDQPQPHSSETVARVAAMLQTEQQEDLIAWGLATVGWQRTREGLPVLLKYRGHRSRWVRRTVANNLLMHLDDDEPISDVVATALLAFTEDSDLDIRWSVLYDVSEYPRVFRNHLGLFADAAARCESVPDERLAEMARVALTVIQDFQESDGDTSE